MAAAGIALAAAGLVLPQGAQAQAADDASGPEQRPQTHTSWYLASGVSYSEGDYGRAMSTSVLAVPVSLRLRHGPWSLRVAVSHLTINGPASIVNTDGGDGAVADGGAPAVPGTETRSGFGDLSVSLGHQFDLSDTTRLVGEVRVKFPTASQAERLSTGTTDLTTRARLSQDVGPVTLRASGQRRFAGGDGRVVLRDTWGASGGASYDLGDSVATGIDLSWLQSSYVGNPANTSLTAYVSAPISRRVRITGYGATGLSRNSPDVTIGTSLTLRLD